MPSAAELPPPTFEPGRRYATHRIVVEKMADGRMGCTCEGRYIVDVDNAACGLEVGDEMLAVNGIAMHDDTDFSVGVIAGAPAVFEVVVNRAIPEVDLTPATIVHLERNHSAKRGTSMGSSTASPSLVDPVSAATAGQPMPQLYYHPRQGYSTSPARALPAVPVHAHGVGGEGRASQPPPPPPLSPPTNDTPQSRVHAAAAAAPTVDASPALPRFTPDPDAPAVLSPPLRTALAEAVGIRQLSPAQQAGVAATAVQYPDAPQGQGRYPQQPRAANFAEMPVPGGDPLAGDGAGTPAHGGATPASAPRSAPPVATSQASLAAHRRRQQATRQALLARSPLGQSFASPWVKPEKHLPWTALSRIESPTNFSPILTGHEEAGSAPQPDGTPTRDLWGQADVFAH